MGVAGGSASCPSDKSSFETVGHSGTSTVASAYEQLLFATAAYNNSAPAAASMPSVRSGTAIYPVKEAAQYIFTVLVGRYIGILSKDVLLNCLQRVHAYVRI